MNRNSIDTKVVVLQKREKPVKGEKALIEAQRKGIEIETKVKFGAASNKQRPLARNAARLDQETEELKVDTVPLDMGKLIQQARQAKSMSQKDLATKINEKPQVIAEFESGRGVVRHDILTKIERALGVSLRGKNRGKVLAEATKTTAPKTTATQTATTAAAKKK